LSEEKINITIRLAERNYPLLVLPADEARVRAAVEKVNATLKELMQKYDGRDMQDYMTMYILMTMAQQANAAASFDVALLNEELQKLESVIDQLIQK
jgi:hypothetical protein